MRKRGQAPVQDAQDLTPEELKDFAEALKKAHTKIKWDLFEKRSAKLKLGLLNDQGIDAFFPRNFRSRNPNACGALIRHWLDDKNALVAQLKEEYQKAFFAEPADSAHGAAGAAEQKKESKPLSFKEEAATYIYQRGNHFCKPYIRETHIVGYKGIYQIVDLRKIYESVDEFLQKNYDLDFKTLIQDPAAKRILQQYRYYEKIIRILKTEADDLKAKFKLFQPEPAAAAIDLLKKARDPHQHEALKKQHQQPKPGRR